MEKTIKILKINILSLIALPLLLIATASKLIAKALEKVAVILGMLAITVFLILGFEFVKNPSGGMEAIAMLVIIFLIGFVFVMIFLFIMTLATTFITVIWTAVISFFGIIYDLTYTGFLKLYVTCESDYQYINLSGSKAANAALCLFFTILHIINKLIVTVISFALPASFILSGLLIIGRGQLTSGGKGYLRYRTAAIYGQI